MKKQNAVAVKVTAEKTKHDFINQKTEIVASDESYKKISNQVFRYIHNQLEEMRKG